MAKRFIQGISFIIIVIFWLRSVCDTSRSAVQQAKFSVPASNMAPLTAIELLTLDSVALQERLDAGLLSSVELVKQCLQQIEAHDRRGLKLNAMISVVPHQTLMTRSRLLDQERAEGRVRGPLHGIPVLVKVGEVDPIVKPRRF